MIKKAFFAILLLTYLTFFVLALYGAKCVFTHKCGSVSTIISGAGSDRVVQVWEGGK